MLDKALKGAQNNRREVASRRIVRLAEMRAFFVSAARERLTTSRQIRKRVPRRAGQTAKPVSGVITPAGAASVLLSLQQCRLTPDVMRPEQLRCGEARSISRGSLPRDRWFKSSRRYQ